MEEALKKSGQLLDKIKEKLNDCNYSIMREAIDENGEVFKYSVHGMNAFSVIDGFFLFERGIKAMKKKIEEEKK